MEDKDKIYIVWGSLLVFLVYFDIFFFSGILFSKNIISDFIIDIVNKTELYTNILYSKYSIIIISILFVGSIKSKKNKDINRSKTFVFIAIGLIGIFSTSFQFLIGTKLFYSILLIISIGLFLKGMANLFNLINVDLKKDLYNEENESFLHVNEKIENDISVNIPIEYSYKKKINKGWINIVAPNRATMILGKPGSGKSYSFVEEIMKQHIQKGFAFVNYDFKFPTLTNIAYDYLLSYPDEYNKYKNKIKFAVINLDDPKYSHRCNPIHPRLIEKIADARSAIYTIFYNIDKKSASKEDFFQMSAGALSTACLVFLRNYKNGIYCSLPHLIEFISKPDEKILKILNTDPELTMLISPFADALEKESFEQLSGQTASARIPLSKLATKEMYYVMTDPDNNGIDLRINLEENATFLNVANNPKTYETNSPALGLIMTQTAKLINEQGRIPTNFMVDELPTIYVHGLDNLIATGRSNLICVTLSFQDLTQLIRDYGKDIGEAIFTTVGNIISGNVIGETARKISEVIGKVVQQRESVSVSNQGTSKSYSQQLDALVPISKISNLGQGAFVGSIADTRKESFSIKAFHGLVSPSKKDQKDRKLPMVNPYLTEEILIKNQLKIQKEIDDLIESELEKLEQEKDKELEVSEELELEAEKELEEIQYFEDL